MANIKVSELNSATTFGDNDLAMIVQSGESKKITKANLLKEIANAKISTFSTTWIAGCRVRGGDILVTIPIFNPGNTVPTLNLTTCEVYDESGSWKTGALVGTGIQGYGTTYMILRINTTGLTVTNGQVYLVRLTGTITCA